MAGAFASSAPLRRDQLLAAPVSTPRPSRLNAPPVAGEGRLASGLRALGLDTVGALLEHLPTDRRGLPCLAEVRAGDRVAVAAEVQAVRSLAVPARRNGRVRSLLEATVADASGSLRAVFFNQPWLAERYAPGSCVLLEGKVDAKRVLRVWSHALDSPSAAVRSRHHDGAAIAHYPATFGVSSTQIAALIRELAPALADVPEVVPVAVRRGAGLPSRAAALAAVHFGDDPAQRTCGRRRLAFEELLLGQLLLLRRRAQRRAGISAPALSGHQSLSAAWLAGGLPFALTGDQLAAVGALDADLGCAHPMQRLLIGEVGSGKTVVALYAMLKAVENGHQAALMAPTETLAEQHAATLTTLLAGAPEPVPVALLTSSTAVRTRRAVLAGLLSGAVPVIVGTHALIESDVAFASLAVAVVDEQHRFGVRQRVALDAKRQREAPHVLHLSATPIPRTLALATHGDLDVTTLRQLPAGRQPVRTAVVAPGRGRDAAYARLRERLAAGGQAYVVCPLASESSAETQHLRVAAAELERLGAAELAGFRLVLMHGQMPLADKQRAMARFVAGDADVMVCTTVVEVGIDVPNANMIVIENAERFGISQLHQLRGRVGRGTHLSECVLVSTVSPTRAPRLRALAEHADGFSLAEIDLRLRGSGELTGTRQSGLDTLRFARLPDDGPLLESARAHAEAIIAADPDLQAAEHVLLGDALAAAFGADAQARLAA
jgi:ATP-dependent DNA helicase RecG